MYVEDFSHIIDSEAEYNKCEALSGVLWRERRRVAQGVNMGQIVTKFCNIQNKQSIAYFCW